MFFGYGLVACVIVGSLIPVPTVAEFSIADKLFHSFTCFVLMVWFGGSYIRRSPVRVGLALAALGVLLKQRTSC